MKEDQAVKLRLLSGVVMQSGLPGIKFARSALKGGKASSFIHRHIGFLRAMGSR